MHIHSTVETLLPEAQKVRRALHEIPETAYQESKTQAYIMEYLGKLSPDSLETLAGTGVKAVFRAKGEGVALSDDETCVNNVENVESVENARAVECVENLLAAKGVKAGRGAIAFRADMDALNVSEATGHGFMSAHPGKMHACGHDGHMTILLLLATLIKNSREKLLRDIVLLFQPAEEGYGGARRMIDDGALRNPDVERVYGLHLWPALPEGKVGIRWGAMMAKTCEFDISVGGVSAHGASPQLGADAVVAAAAFISLLQTAITRNLDPHQDAILTIGKIVGGTARNIIADNVEMNATLRVFSQEVYEQLMGRIRSMADGVALATGTRITVKPIIHYPCVDNPRPLVEDFYRYVHERDRLIAEPVMAAEDFSFYQQEIPGLFFFLGTGTPEFSHPLHNERFDFDEKVLLNGVEIYRRMVYEDRI